MIQNPISTNTRNISIHPNRRSNKKHTLLIYSKNKSYSLNLTKPIIQISTPRSTASAHIGTTSIGGVLFNPLTEIHDSWNSRNGGLTGAGTAVIAVVAVAAIAVTAGAAGTAVGGAIAATGAAAGGGVATAAAVAGVMVGAATTAAITSATVTLAISTVNNGGNIGQAVKDTASKESLKNIAVSAAAAALTAGVMNGLERANIVASASTAATQIASVGDLGKSLGNALARSAVNTTTSVAAQSTLNGDSFKDSLKLQAVNILIGAVGQVGAEQIGVASHGTVDQYGNVVTAPSINMPVQLALHAGLGCAMAAAGGNNCGAGAAAGVTGELIGSSLRSSVDDGSMKRSTALALAESGSALAAAAIVNPDDGDSVFAGSRIGRNAAENNALLYRAGTNSNPKQTDKEFIKAME